MYGTRVRVTHNSNMQSGAVLEAAVGDGVMSFLQRMHAYLTPGKPGPRPKRLALLLRLFLRLEWWLKV
jgi:hypothetical protein